MLNWRAGSWKTFSASRGCLNKIEFAIYSPVWFIDNVRLTFIGTLDSQEANALLQQGRQMLEETLEQALDAP